MRVSCTIECRAVVSFLTRDSSASSPCYRHKRAGDCTELPGSRRYCSGWFPKLPSGGRFDLFISANPSKKQTTRSGGRFVSHLQRRASRNGNNASDWQPGFWEGEEGKAKWKEIEETKELVVEAVSLADQVSSEGEDLSESERRDRLRTELTKKAKEQSARRREAEAMFEMGQRAYGRGAYDTAVEILEGGLAKVPATSQLGGEIQIWLAMAYEADGRQEEGIAMYKRLEVGHPMILIRRQAKNLRYIREAPKLKLSQDEMVTIPLIDVDDAANYKKRRTWSERVRERRQAQWVGKAGTKKDPLEQVLSDWRPPSIERNRYFWVAFTLWLMLVALALVQKFGLPDSTIVS